MFLEDSAQIPSRSNYIPCIRPNDVIFRSDAQLSKYHPFEQRELFVQTFLYVEKLRTAPGCIYPDVSVTRPDAFNVRQRKWFRSKTQIWKTAATVQTMCVPVQMLSLIRQVIHTKFNRLNVSLHSPDARALIWKLRAAEVQLSGR
jgi:hypothetical protein